MTKPPPNTNPFAMFEPSADIRSFAASVREIYVSLLQAGFEPAEALALTGNVITGVVSAKTRGNGDN